MGQFNKDLVGVGARRRAEKKYLLGAMAALADGRLGAGAPASLPDAIEFYRCGARCVSPIDYVRWVCRRVTAARSVTPNGIVDGCRLAWAVEPEKFALTMAKNTNRDEFTPATKRAIERQARGHCSNPVCRRLTSAATSDGAGEINIGEAAHICAAASGGPRYDKNMTIEERRGTENGIWLCDVCARAVDEGFERSRSRSCGSGNGARTKIRGAVSCTTCPSGRACRPRRLMS